MPLLVSLIEQDDPGELVDSSNVHRCCPFEIPKLQISLTNQKKDESFALSYLLSHTSKIKQLRIVNGSAVTFTKLLLQLERATCCIDALDVTGIAKPCWDANATKLLNRIFLDASTTTSKRAPLRSLAFTQVHNNMNLSGINITSLHELRLPMVNEFMILDVAIALHAGCRLSSFRITGIHLSKILPAVMEALCNSLSLLKHLTRLSIVIYDSAPDTVRRLAESLPPSLRQLAISWNNPNNVEDIASFSACMSSLVFLDIRFPPGVRGAPGRSDVMMNVVMLQLLNECRGLQYLSIGILRKTKQSILPFLQQLSSSSVTTLQTLVLRIPLVFGNEQGKCCDCIHRLLRNNRGLRDFRYPLIVGDQQPTGFHPLLRHLLRLNRLHFHDKILPDTSTIPLALWPRLLSKAAPNPSVVYELLLEKNDALIHL